MSAQYSEPLPTPTDLLDRIRLNDLTPPPGFDPLATVRDPDLKPQDLSLLNEQLASFWLPTVPEAAAQPELFELWATLFAEPLQYRSWQKNDFALSFSGVQFRPRLSGPGGSNSGVIGGGHNESSANWSGGYITSRHANMFTQLWGTWTVPTVSVPAGDPAGLDYESSIWIGLDGQRRYADSSLPQFGTRQALVAGVATYEAWVQWWDRGQLNPLPAAIGGLAINPGDRMMAWLGVVSLTDVICVLANLTTLNVAIVAMTSPVVQAVQRQITGATAEWILERPTKINSTNLYALPDYGSVDFQALAVASPVPGTIGTGETQSMEGARLIRMYEMRDPPLRTITRSGARRATVPSIHGLNTSFVPP